mmetsp:Transcript_20723/g.26408  ORF Transcript_20723/g.26408 Transcript_20723/m.26408 type:complete len:540 (-) Transcript_20723:730-2349(-)
MARKLKTASYLFIFVVASLILKPVSALFGFGSGGDKVPQKSSKYGCVCWRQTGNCDPDGPREENGDSDCGAVVRNGRSGYCECIWGGKTSRVPCRHADFRCHTACANEIKSLEVSEDMKWIENTVWNWNNWRDVTFASNNVFQAPTADCEAGECSWTAKDGLVYIMWGNAGLHTVAAPSKDVKKISGIRYDGEPLSAAFVRKLNPEETEESDDYYALLGLDPEATDSEIRKSYRKLSRELHPDKYSGSDREEAEQKFIKIQKAYEVLKDEETRMVYDTGGIEAVEAINNEQGDGGGMDPFSMFFGGGGGGRKNRGHTAKAQVGVSLEDMYNGNEQEVQYDRRVVCRNCKKITAKNKERCSKCGACPPEVKMVQRNMGGFLVQQQEQVPSKEKCMNAPTTLNLVIEKGMSSGAELVFERMGEQTPGQIPGDVVIVLEQKPHASFSRTGNDLKTTVHISLKEALTGVTHTFSHLDGREMKVETQPGEIISPLQVMKLQGEGMPVHEVPSQYGDMFLEFDVHFPKTLNPSQVAKLRELLPDE